MFAVHITMFSCPVAEQLAAVPALANLGSLFKSSQLPIELTESETEYNVRCVKHMFPNHVVFQVTLTFHLTYMVSEQA